MAAMTGVLDTRILVAVGDADPIELGTLTVDVKATHRGRAIEVSSRAWRRGLAFALARMAWATLTMHDARHRTTDPACVRHREPRTHCQRLRFDRGRGYGCEACQDARQSVADAARP